MARFSSPCYKTYKNLVSDRRGANSRGYSYPAHLCHLNLVAKLSATILLLAAESCIFLPISKRDLELKMVLQRCCDIFLLNDWKMLVNN